MTMRGLSRNQIAKFGRMDSTAQNTKNGLIRLFMNRIYDSDMIQCVIKKHRTLQFGDSCDYMMRLMDLSNCNKSKEGIFQMTSDSRGRLETLHSSSLFSKSFVSSYTDVPLIEGTHKTNIHDLSLIVTTVVDSLGKYVPIIFLLVPSEY